jgi:nitrate reductase NapE
LALGHGRKLQGYSAIAITGQWRFVAGESAADRRTARISIFSTRSTPWSASEIHDYAAAPGDLQTIRGRGDAMHTEKKRELMAFGFLALVLVPILSVIVVAGFGFIVWMYQIIAGPPGPPPT